MSSDITGFSSYEEACRSCQLDIPARFNVADSLGRHTDPDRPALYVVSSTAPRIETMSFRDLHEAAARVASGFRRLGVGPGSRVCVALSSTAESAIAIFAAMRVGAAAVGIRIVAPDAVPTEQLDLVRPALIVCELPAAEALERATGAQIVTTRRGDWATACGPTAPPSPGRWPTLFELLREGDPDDPVEPTAATDPAFITFTSGSMGAVKAVVFPHSSFPASLPAFQMYTNLGPKPGDRFFSSLGWATGGGLRNLAWPAWHSGAPVVAVDGVADGRTIARILSGLRVTVALLMPQILREIRDASDDIGGYDWSALRTVAYAGESINSALHEWLEAEFEIIVQPYYGAAEIAYVASTCREWFPSDPGGVGRLVPGRQVAVLDEDLMTAVPAGAAGMLAIRRSDPALALGYLRADSETPAYDAASANDEFFLTGDLAVMDEAGEFRYLGRSGQLIRTKTDALPPMDLEDAVLSVSGIREATAIQTSSDGPGTFCACVSLAGEHSIDALARAVADAVTARFGDAVAVGRVLVYTELPKTAGTSKINRRLAAAAVESGTPEPVAAVTVGDASRAR